MRPLGPLVKVLALVVATVLMTGALIAVFGGYRVEPTTTYRAVFRDISGIQPGSAVRAAGVDVGRVESAERLPDNTIRLSFTVGSGFRLPTGATAAVRYQNLVGDRYLLLGPGPGPSMLPGGTIPVARTQPALDLDELYNGFTPLFQGLEPDQLNRLSASLIVVLQGQGSATGELLTHLGSVTGTLADRGALVSDTIRQLSAVLGTLNRRTPELNDTIVQMQALVSGLAGDREQIGRSLRGVNELTTSLDALLTQVRPELKGTVHQIDRFAETINSDHAALANLIKRLPGYYIPLGRLGANQSAFQFYVCGVQLRFTTPGGHIYSPFINSGNVPRC